jgi:hypothetical protein
MKNNVPSSEDTKKTFWADVPEWAEKISDEQILKTASKIESDTQLMEWKASQKGMCYVYKRILHTSKEHNIEYALTVWPLSTPEILQSASVQEQSLGLRDHLLIHRIKVLRNGKILDKKTNVVVRVLDDESGSLSGTLLKMQKANLVISDLRLGDVLIAESSKVTTFDESNVLDQKYYRYIQPLATGIWLYATYEFKVMNDRAENICVKKKYFRDMTGSLVDDDGAIVGKGETFEFVQLKRLSEPSSNYFSPFLEIATVATWEGIGVFIHSLYREPLSNAEPLRIGDGLATQLASASTVDDKIRLVIEYVQDQIIYLFDAEVIHAHIPQSVQQVFETNSGDCKAKSLLLVKLLDSIRVEAKIVLINYSFDRYIQEMLPSPFAFNHAIVEIERNGKHYFIDPTWSNRSGYLDYRGEPLFATYLQIDGRTGISHRDESPSSFFAQEETANIELRGTTGKIDIQVIYRGISADLERHNLRNNSTEQMIQYYNAGIKERLQTKTEDKDLFANASYAVMSDDKEKNEITVLYRAELRRPMQHFERYLIFRYWYPFDDKGLLNFDNRDARIESFLAFPWTRTVHIKAGRPFLWWEHVTRRSLAIDNKYFAFSNKKDNGISKANVQTTFKPKTYGEVARDELNSLREDIKQIVDSNCGIGIAYFANAYGWAFVSWRFVYIAIVLSLILLGILSGR